MICHRSGAMRLHAALMILSFFLFFVDAAAQTQVAVQPATMTVTTPASFTLDIAVNNVDSLHTASITCTFDPGILSYSTAIVDTSFLKGGMMFSARIIHGPVYDSLVVVPSIFGPGVVSGSGVIVKVTFMPLKAGTTPIGICDIMLLGGATYVTRISATAVDGEVIVEMPVPVTISSFAAFPLVGEGAVRLEWSTLSEITNYGFEIDRRRDGEATFARVPESFVAGNGTTLQPNTYSFVDITVPGSGRYEYRLRQIDQDGTEHFFDGAWVDILLSSVAETEPGGFELMPNWPNPFNPTTTIRFTIGGVVALSGASSSGVEGPAANNVHLAVYDLLGREVAVLVDESKSPGAYEVKFDGTHLPSGAYIYRLMAGDRVESRRMILAK